MARFIPSKSSTQCRTHHEKKIQDLKKMKHPAPEREYLRRFYYENFMIRRLGEAHLRDELKGFVEDLRAMPKCTVVGVELDELRDSIEAVLAEFGNILKLPDQPPETAQSPLRGTETETSESGPRAPVRVRRGGRRVNVGVGMAEERVVVEFASESREEGEALFWSDI